MFAILCRCFKWIWRWVIQVYYLIIIIFCSPFKMIITKYVWVALTWLSQVFCAVKSTQSRLENFGNICCRLLSKRSIATEGLESFPMRNIQNILSANVRDDQEECGRLQNGSCSQFWPEKVIKLQRVEIKLLALLKIPHGDILNDRKYLTWNITFPKKKFITKSWRVNSQDCKTNLENSPLVHNQAINTFVVKEFGLNSYSYQRYSSRTRGNEQRRTRIW